MNKNQNQNQTFNHTSRFISKKLFVILGCFLLQLLLAQAIPQAYAQTTDLGCCCDPLTRSGGFQPRTECPQEYIFLTNISLGQTCNTLCEARLPPNIPTNCTSLEPQTVRARPLAGQSIILVSWQTNCGADYAEIERCTGTACTGFTQLAQEQGTSYLDQDSVLIIGQDITYRIRLQYTALNKTTAYVSTTTNLGDIECQDHTADTRFCITPFTYASHKQYFLQKGYQNPTNTIPSVAKETFAQAYDATINTTFFSRFNNAFTCTSENKLKLQWACPTGKACINNPTKQCAQLTLCQQQQTLFGLYSTPESCEQQTTSQNTNQNINQELSQDNAQIMLPIISNSYCFFDRS
ncbi:MAG: hypothetical protein Q7K43_01145, partial [Candidatus Woesearchaeota archaeon]|nr:hypothetical protein [Candidatus Woesearchaeota archaeon]